MQTQTPPQNVDTAWIDDEKVSIFPSSESKVPSRVEILEDAPRPVPMPTIPEAKFLSAKDCISAVFAHYKRELPLRIDTADQIIDGSEVKFADQINNQIIYATARVRFRNIIQWYPEEGVMRLELAFSDLIITGQKKQ